VFFDQKRGPILTPPVWQEYSQKDALFALPKVDSKTAFFEGIFRVPKNHPFFSLKNGTFFLMHF
jgi:hypothetical protein